MRIVTKANGVKTEHDLPKKPITAVVHQSGIKVEAPDAYTIDATMTMQCMRDMSEKAWTHISTGPLFKHFFDTLFQKGVTIPTTVKELVEDYDDGVVHGSGLIVLLVEAMFAGKQEVHLKYPETYLHPAQQQWLMTVIMDIQKLSGGPGAQPVQVPT